MKYNMQMKKIIIFNILFQGFFVIYWLYYECGSIPRSAETESPLERRLACPP
jgi:hypothetical protein